ncbi:hypothetical protein ABZ832_09280 [Streptantibioticus parmotrematis]|uniref:hypothetical protein n=1 Tax=Streptantibioticus parmotrematis TaxID=2873249 RepID=UPI0033E3D509
MDAKADEARSKADELDGTPAEPSVRLDNGDLDAKEDKVKAKLDELDELDDKGATARLKLADAEFNAKFSTARAKLDQMNAASASPRLGASTSGSGGVESAGSLGSGDGGPGGSLAMGLGALMPELGGAVVGLGALGAVGAMTFGPIGKALEAAHQAPLNVGLTHQELAATQFSNQGPASSKRR